MTFQNQINRHKNTHPNGNIQTFFRWNAPIYPDSHIPQRTAYANEGRDGRPVRTKREAIACG
ncbi:MAG TPA: hypothetical protein DCX97_08545, partial [Alistipes sp.]|nr:hypothetical protein [Alistipes sp.]